MDALATKLACKRFEIAAAIAYAYTYDIECDPGDLRPYGSMLWIYNSGCLLPFHVACQIQDLVNSIKYTERCETREYTIDCDLTVMQVVDPPPTCAPLSIEISQL